MRCIDVGFEAGIDAGRKAVARRALQDARDLGELDVELRRADDAHLAVGEFQIVLVGLQHVARDLLRLVGDRLRREMHRRAGGHRLPAGEAAEAERHAGGVAGHDLHLVDVDAELRSRAICAIAVPSPWPIADAPVKTVTLPVREMRTSPDSNGPRPVPFTPCASPMPR